MSPIGHRGSPSGGPTPGGVALARTHSIRIGLVTLALAVAGPVSAEMAPNPVENGDFYFSGGIALYTYRTENLQVGRRYADDDFSGSATISTEHPRGFLMTFKTDEDQVVTPELNFGYAFEEPLFKGALGSRTRLHFAAYGNRREGFGVVPYAEPAAGAWPLFNPSTGQIEARDTFVYVQPIDGSLILPNGDDATWFHSFPLENNTMAFRTYFGSGDMMIWFDEPEGPFQFSRGGGLTVGYENSQFAWGIDSPQLGAAAAGLAPASWTYAFQLHTVYIGPRLAFSMGFEPVRPISLFLAGGFAPMLAVSSISGTEVGQCLAACTIAGPGSTGAVGVASLDATDVNFAYDARVEAGLSFYLYVLRVAATVGVFANNQFAMPQEGDGSRYETVLGGQWGYYGRAMATFSF
jgi:hypothetical protein